VLIVHTERLQLDSRDWSEMGERDDFDVIPVQVDFSVEASAAN